jgi:transposase
LRFVPIKSVDQQARLAWHRVREGYKVEALAIANRMRGLLAEFGLIVARSDAALRVALADLDTSAEVPVPLRELVRELAEHWTDVRTRMAACESRIEANGKADERCRRVRAMIGIGPLTADAVVASIGSATEFKNGRQLAAWLGLVPAQHSSGGHSRLGSISCRGDVYLRTLLIQGARTSLQRARTVAVEKATPEQVWIRRLAARTPFGKLLVAIANKHARQLWAMLAKDHDYDPQAWLHHPMVQRPAGRHAMSHAMG